MLAGMLLGVLFYRPIFDKLYTLSDTKTKTTVYMQLPPGSYSNFISYTDGTQMKISPSANGPKKEIIVTGNIKWKMIGLITVMVLFVTMVYGPIAAFLVELFPTRIRYTSMSLPYHIGNGVFGGLVPFIATLITTMRGSDHLSGLWYPIIISAICFVIGALYINEKSNKMRSS
jgi:hypothetical protein